MSDFSDADLRALVERVVRQAMGLESSRPAAERASTPPVVQASAAPSVPVAVQPAPSAPAAGGRKAVAIGADHGGFEMKETLKKYLTELGYEVVDCGTNSKEAVDYPDFAFAVAQLVAQGKVFRGIMIDGAGIGSCMAANKVPGVRAAMCYDHATAVNSREHNDANLLTLGAGMIGENLAKQIVKVWLESEFGGGRHSRRVEKIVQIEKLYLKS